MRTAQPRGRRLLKACAITLLAAGSVAAPSVAMRGGDDDRGCGREGGLIVIVHRGASGHRPEHTPTSYELGRPIGIHPETKHPTHLRSTGVPLEPRLVTALRRSALAGRRARVFVRSFETGSLKALNQQIDVPLVQRYGGRTRHAFDLVGTADKRSYGDHAAPAGLADMATYAAGAGPSKDYIVRRDGAGASLPPTTSVDDAHAAGLVVRPYRLRNENQFPRAELCSGADPNANANADAVAEDEQFFKLGVDGIFTDNSDTAVLARRELG